MGLDCPFCGIVLTSPLCLDEHVKSIHLRSDDVIKCSICGAVFSSRRAAREHAQKTHL